MVRSNIHRKEMQMIRNSFLPERYAVRRIAVAKMVAILKIYFADDISAGMFCIERSRMIVRRQATTDGYQILMETIVNFRKLYHAVNSITKEKKKL